jgi:hypothetical protein
MRGQRESRSFSTAYPLNYEVEDYLRFGGQL